MMTASQFKKQSNLRFRRRKNPIIKDIDKLLKEYTKSTSENRKMKCMVYIYMMCKQYFQSKPNGSRGDAVQSLLDQVKQEIDSPMFKQKIGAKAGGLHYKGGVKKDMMSTSGARATSMAPGYTFEGILPQKNFVEKMKLNMDSIMGDKNYFGASMVSQKVEEDLQVNQGMQGDQSAQEAARLMKTMPMSKVLDYLHNLWADPYADGSFNYLNAAQRLDYLLTMKNGMLYKYPSNAPFHTHEGRATMAPFAMDNNERMYSGMLQGVGVNWNHSSLLSGHPVVCAGEMEVSQGRLVKIDNNSGHYKPGTDQLVDCVIALQAGGLNLQTFAVHDKVTSRNYATAAQFIAANP